MVCDLGFGPLFIWPSLSLSVSFCLSLLLRERETNDPLSLYLSGSFFQARGERERVRDMVAGGVGLLFLWPSFSDMREREQRQIDMEQYLSVFPAQGASGPSLLSRSRALSLCLSVILSVSLSYLSLYHSLGLSLNANFLSKSS